MACIEIQDVLLENIHEFNIWGQTSNTPEVLRSRTLIKLLLFWHIPVVNLRHFLIMFGCVTSVQNYWVLQTKSLHRWVPVITAWRVLRLRVEEQPPVRRVAANILNKQSRKADKGWSSSLGLGEGLTTPHSKNVSCCEIFTQKALDLDWYYRDRWWALVSAVMNIRVPWNAGNFLTSCKPVSFSRRTLYHGVSK